MKNAYTVERAIVATTPRHLVTQDGLPITSFRIAETFTKPSHGSGGDTSVTNWFTVTSFGKTAIQMASEVTKGMKIGATGILLIRDWDNGERAGTSVELEVTEYSILDTPVPKRDAHDCNCEGCYR